MSTPSLVIIPKNCDPSVRQAIQQLSTKLGPVAEVTHAELTLTGLTDGGVLFSNSGLIDEDYTNFFWDNTNNILRLKHTSRIQRNETTVSGALLEFYKSNLSGANPAIVAVNDKLGEVNFYGYDSNEYLKCASIYPVIVGTPADDDLRVDWYFAARGNADADVTTIMKLTRSSGVNYCNTYGQWYLQTPAADNVDSGLYLFGSDAGAGRSSEIHFYANYPTDSTLRMHIECRGYGDDKNYLRHTSDFILSDESNTAAKRLFHKASGNISIGYDGDYAKLDVLATSGEQLRLTYADNSVYAGFTVDSSGDLTLTASGGEIFLPDVVHTHNISNLHSVGDFSVAAEEDLLLSTIGGTGGDVILRPRITAVLTASPTAVTLAQTLDMDGNDIVDAGDITGTSLNTVNIIIGTDGIDNIANNLVLSSTGGGTIDFSGDDTTTTGLGTFGSLIVDTDTLVVNVSGYTDKVGIGTATPRATLHTVAATFALTPLFERLVAFTSTPGTGGRFQLTTTGDMADGFGPLLAFCVRDESNVDYPLGFFGAVMAGANNTGDLVFQPSLAGVNTEKMRIKAAGEVLIPDELLVETSIGVGTNQVVPTSQLQVGRNTVFQQWTDVDNPQVLIQGVDNETTVMAFQIKDENQNEYFRVSSIAGETDGFTAVSGKLRVGDATVPTSKLNIVANTDDQGNESAFHGFIIETGTDDQTMFMGYDGTDDAGYINVAKTGSIRPLGLQTRGGGVGIGTVSPDTTLQVVGTAGFGDDSGNETLFSTTGDMTFVGTATVWNDMQFQISDAKVTPASLLPSWEEFTPNTSEYAFSVNDEVDTSANEIPHSWKQGTVGNAHIHITTKAVPAQEEKARFTVTFAYADTDEVWVEAPLTAELTIPISTTALTNFYLDLGDITLTNYLIEAQMRCRVKRIAKSAGGTEYGGDIFITQIGVHFEEDTVGSTTERVK